MSEQISHTINTDKEQPILACSNELISSYYDQAKTLLQQQEQSKSQAEKRLLTSQACKLLRLDAESGHVEAQYTYAQCLKSSMCTEKDMQESLLWLKKAAAQQHRDAQFELAMLLPLEDEQHLVLLTAAAQQGHAQAMLCMAMHEQRQFNMPQALYWLNLAKDHQIPKAYYLLAQLYRYGQGVNQCAVETVNLLSQAAELGYVEAYFELFEAYKSGYGVGKNKSTALKYLQLARDHQHIEAASIEFAVS